MRINKTKNNKNISDIKPISDISPSVKDAYTYYSKLSSLTPDREAFEDSEDRAEYLKSINYL